ncbi:MAG: 23S rRNA (pseudouridine(1915)-N(3))-methyltransferase RlmH [Lachnospiraceae bacterium]|nr:23S rRNA (pseudouridine(1915)-N(3))-methyltransferase RlmH [Lachnospiraceae bacterium]
MKITILCAGKIKEKFYVEAIKEYSKRLGRYCRLEIIETADEKTPAEPSDNEINIVKKKEAERIERHISSNAYVIALAIDGRKVSSEKFASIISGLGVNGTSHIQFIIGGSLGLDENLLKQADLKLSFSDMTFPHQLMRVILLEQVYRAYRIINGEPYHK